MFQLTSVFDQCMERLEQFQNAAINQSKVASNPQLDQAITELARQIPKFRSDLRHAVSLAAVETVNLAASISAVSELAIDSGATDELLLSDLSDLFQEIPADLAIYPFGNAFAFIDEIMSMADDSKQRISFTNRQLSALVELQNLLLSLANSFDEGRPPTGEQLAHANSHLRQLDRPIRESGHRIWSVSNLGFPEPKTKQTKYDPAKSRLSGKVARTNPLENTPENRARLQGDGVIVSTVADHMMRFFDRENINLADYPQEERSKVLRRYLELFGWTIEDFRSSEEFPQTGPRGSLISQRGEFAGWEADRFARFRELRDEDSKVERDQLRQIVDMLGADYELADPEAANQEADKLQERISSGEMDDRETDLACLRRDSLRSGYLINGAEFVNLMLSPTRVFGDVLKHPPEDRIKPPSPLAAQWLQAMWGCTRPYLPRIPA